MGIAPPDEVDVRRPVPVLRGQRHAWAVVRLQQGRVDQVVGIHDALGQSAGHLAVVHGVFDLLLVVLTLLSSVTADVVNHPYQGEFPMYLIINRVGDGSRRLAEHDVLLTHSRVAYHRTHQCQRHEGR